LKLYDLKREKGAYASTFGGAINFFDFFNFSLHVTMKKKMKEKFGDIFDFFRLLVFGINKVGSNELHEVIGFFMESSENGFKTMNLGQYYFF